ncbi:sulfurtransferase, partial [bacterium]|nr:sulfurtransferase [bacterium]
NLVVAEIRWVHNDPDAAYRNFQAGHIPCAIYVDLDRELSDISDPKRGRHPLPDPAGCAELLGQKGIGPGKHVICSDDTGGTLAPKLWWQLRWLGFDDCSLLDGGFLKWKAEGREIESGIGRLLAPLEFKPSLRPNLMVDSAELKTRLARGEPVLDARSAERFCGEQEGIDQRAGHIEGALSLPLTEFMCGDPRHMKSVEEIAAIARQMNLRPDEPITAYCGSGVTACVLLHGLHSAGFTNLHLYPGSWSEWIQIHPEAGVRAHLQA